MRRRTNPLVALADGFSLTDSLAAPRYIAYKQSRKEDGYSQKLFVERMDGGDARTIYDEARHSLNCAPSWSPDGTVLYHSHDQIVAIDVSTGNTRTVTDFQNGERANWHLSCSTDGKTLAFLDFPPSGPETGKAAPHRLCTIGTDGADLRLVLESPEGYRIWQTDVSWQARKGIVSAIMPQQGTGFWSVDLDGGDPIRIGQAPSSVHGFQLSPDGQHLIYACDGLHVISLADGQSRQISRSGTDPSWSPDGKQIAFMHGDFELWTISVADGQFQKLVWFGGRNYFPHTTPGRGSYAHTPQWSPDGRHLWFGLTKSRRLRKADDPEFLQSLKEDIDAGKGHLGQMSPDERRRVYENALKREHWDYIHMHGIVDFSDNRVMVRDGYWANVAWAPLNKDTE